MLCLSAYSTCAICWNAQRKRCVRSIAGTSTHLSLLPLVWSIIEWCLFLFGPPLNSVYFCCNIYDLSYHQPYSSGNWARCVVLSLPRIVSRPNTSCPALAITCSMRALWGRSSCLVPGNHSSMISRFVQNQIFVRKVLSRCFVKKSTKSNNVCDYANK